MTDPTLPVDDPGSEALDPTTADAVAAVTVPPGTQSTEYRLTVTGSVVSLLGVIIALFHPGFTIPQQTQTAMVTVLSAAVPLLIGWYSKLRNDLKRSSHAATASIMASRPLTLLPALPAAPTYPAPSTLPDISEDDPAPAEVLSVDAVANAGALLPAVDDPRAA